MNTVYKIVSHYSCLFYDYFWPENCKWVTAALYVKYRQTPIVRTGSYSRNSNRTLNANVL